MQSYYVEVDDERNIRWYNNSTEKRLHRVDGPAVECHHGHKAWFLNGQLHRVDGPAVENAYGDKTWYLNDQLHKVDGPAIEWADGHKCWFLNGKELTESQHQAAIKQVDSCEGKVVEVEGKKYKLIAL